MASIFQVRGLLLEEILLYLLRKSGYKTIDSAGIDPTLKPGKSGLEVLGRGGRHQIDAIADYILSQPFTNPQRLLVEAKFTGSPVQLQIVRNAVGVLKDVSEYFIPQSKTTLSRRRYSYQYAIFSAFGYSSPAEHYAFAQDIYLIPLTRSAFFAPINAELKKLSDKDFGALNGKIKIRLKGLRDLFRHSLNSNTFDDLDLLPDGADKQIGKIWEETKKIDNALLAMISNRFPVFLVPKSKNTIANLNNETRVRIYWDEKGWYLYSLEHSQEEELFSFDLPDELFEQYAIEGSLSATQALEIKQQSMGEIQALHTDGNSVRVLRFLLDRNWLDKLRQKINIEK